MHTKIDARKLKYWGLLVLLYASGPLFFISTSPRALPLPLLIFPFLWLFACLFITSWLLLKSRKSFSRKQTAIVSGTIATIPVLLALFQSIHQLSIRDVLLSVGLVVLATIYLLRADFIK